LSEMRIQRLIAKLQLRTIIPYADELSSIKAVDLEAKKKMLRKVSIVSI